MQDFVSNGYLKIICGTTYEQRQYGYVQGKMATLVDGKQMINTMVFASGERVTVEKAVSISSRTRTWNPHSQINGGWICVTSEGTTDGCGMML